MGYRIVYPHKRKIFRSNVRVTVLTVLCFFFFLLLVEVRWPDGAALIRSAIHSARESLPVSAMNVFAEELRSEGPIRDIISTIVRGPAA